MKKINNIQKIITLLIVVTIMACSILPFFIKGNYPDIEFKVTESTYENIEIDPYELIIQKMQEELEVVNMIEDKEQWFISYKALIHKYKNAIDPPLTIYDYYTEEEINLIQRVVETECYGQDFESKANVACVVLNRIDDGRFGETVKAVITAKNQFAYGRKIITESTVNAVEYAFGIEDTTDGCLFFRSGKWTKNFNGAEWVFTDSAGHHFYRPKENK